MPPEEKRSMPCLSFVEGSNACAVAGKGGTVVAGSVRGKVRAGVAVRRQAGGTVGKGLQRKVRRVVVGR